MQAARPVRIRATVRGPDCAEHPAVTAWLAFSGLKTVPYRIDVLRDLRKSSTYRLFGGGPSGASLIAQRARADKAINERIVYEQILPSLPLTAPRLYGFKPESAEYSWMFLEDVGDQRYVEENPAHRALAARWVGRMHCAASRVPAARSLPETGPPRYFKYLETAHQTLRAMLAAAPLSQDQAETLRRMGADLGALESDWAQVERACADIPISVAHGDFRPKNALLRAGTEGLQVFPIDWETAGWGVPAADLTRIDLRAYHSVIQATWWRGARLGDVERMAAVGSIFRHLSSLLWAVPDLAHSDPGRLSNSIATFRPGHTLRGAHERLMNAVRELRTITRAL